MASKQPITFAVTTKRQTASTITTHLSQQPAAEVQEQQLRSALFGGNYEGGDCVMTPRSNQETLNGEENQEIREHMGIKGPSKSSLSGVTSRKTQVFPQNNLLSKHHPTKKVEINLIGSTQRKKEPTHFEEEKRSRSEAPSQAAFTQVLQQIQKKFQDKQLKLSPARILAKHNERQEKAMRIRQQIEFERQIWFDKLHSRQENVRVYQIEQLEKKSLKLKNRLKLAQDRQSTALMQVKTRARAENQRMQETNFIYKMTKQNEQLDLESRMTETEERRKQILGKKVTALKQIHEAANSKRRELSEEQGIKKEHQTQKQNLAQKRREEQVRITKMKASQETSKHEFVKANKNYLGRKILDIMSLVNNSDSLWDFVQVERDWKNLGISLDIGQQKNGQAELVDEILHLISKDQFELEKLMLRRDQEILNNCLEFTEQGKIIVKFSPKLLIQQNKLKNQFEDSSSSGGSKSASPSRDHLQDSGGKEKEVQSFEVAAKHLTDEYFEQQLQQQRFKMSMRRNILRKTLSEDLDWADGLKNDPNLLSFHIFSSQILNKGEHEKRRTRSFESSPDRRKGGEFDDLLSAGEDEKTKHDTPQVSKKKNGKQRKGRKSLMELVSKVDIPTQALTQKNKKPTMSKTSSFSSLGSFNVKPTDGPSKSNLNQQSLDQLGPIVKMTINGFPFTSQFNFTASTQQLSQQDPEGSQSFSSFNLMSQTTPTSFQMNSLIMNQKPLPTSKIYAGNLSKIASQYLFPIREQKLLLMYPIDKRFAEAKITVSMQEVGPAVSSEIPTEGRPHTPTSPKEMKSPILSPTKASNLKVTDAVELQDIISKYIMQDCLAHLKVDDSQKSISFESEDADRVLKHLEQYELHFKYCRVCETKICEESHFHSRAHVKKRDDLGIKEAEDLLLSMVMFNSTPGSIEAELIKEKEKALKRKVKRIKQQINATAVTHENASTYPGKELSSSNKKRLQIRCMELEKSVFPMIQNYEVVEAILNDIIKVMEQRSQADLHLMRKLKFIPTLIDICKRVSLCNKNQIKSIGKLLSLVIKIVNSFCSNRENRNYMLQTNRLMPLLELFIWCLNRTTQVFYGIDFLPSLFQIFTQHLRHRVPFECQAIKELFIDLLISSTLTMKIKQKHSIIKSIPSQELMNETLGSHIPFVILKSTQFLEALTGVLSIDARTRPVYEKSIKIGEHVLFVLQKTELFGIIQMITTLLLTFNVTFKVSCSDPQNMMILPQTVMSLAVVSMKVLNNTFRMDLIFVQRLMKADEDQVYHLIHYILSYADAHIDKEECQNDVKELLHETLIFIGYYCLQNEEGQAMLQRGNNCILQKLCNLPFIYFMDKRNREILYPTLIIASYQNERSMAILHQEIDLVVLTKFLEINVRDELPKILEDTKEDQSDSKRSKRSPGGSSQGSNSTCSALSIQMDFMNGNNPYTPLVMRFPKQLWKEAAKYFKSNQ